ncbi:hypothetical protein [Asticcacaulis benevestitus]|uniref:Uncharacterized protein n=1 Tax=Asticcacaulis benevestitus DSM 16100 = ATCC BAA-896 TaxID=1121022 RepID=V4PXE9_9CAUL|nr:hypothetical protein [Asticcacaulis benevestitus]ESQ90260.1 hypothetical protein ABENE_12845 [Asticcacaulis benevestitus DSM 16100 = ATCC BAA-896]
MKLSAALTHLTLRLLPEHRRIWGEAMAQEARLIETEFEAIEFTLGCLWTATQERIKHMTNLVNIGRWSIGIVTALYGAFFLKCFGNFVAIALGSPDPYYNMLIAHHHAEVAADYLAWQPFTALFLFCMGISHLVAALFLIRWNVRRFTLACLGATLPGIMLLTFGLTRGLPALSVAWPFFPLLLLTCAALALWRMANRPQAPLLAS